MLASLTCSGVTFLSLAAGGVVGCCAVSDIATARTNVVRYGAREMFFLTHCRDSFWKRPLSAQLLLSTVTGITLAFDSPAAIINLLFMLCFTQLRFSASPFASVSMS
jgi:hypothetical protein